MNILVLGGNGMLGHRLALTLQEQGHQVLATERSSVAFRRLTVPTCFGVQATVASLEPVIRDCEPDVVVNCIGVVKQRLAIHDTQTIAINALWPHQLYELCRHARARLIHISTDCVFSGLKGYYNETDIPDPVDLYGRSKLLGEVFGKDCLTLRTSIIGLELSRSTGLIEWFLSREGTVRGFTQAIYSGLTTSELSRLIAQVIVEHQGLCGVWHVASAPIDKYSLLVDLSRKLSAGVIIHPDDSVVCDRSLSAEAFQTKTGYEPPDWDTMLTELAGLIQARS